MRGFEAEWCGSGVFPRAVAIILAGKMRDSGKSERKQETFDKDSMALFPSERELPLLSRTPREGACDDREPFSMRRLRGMIFGLVQL